MSDKIGILKEFYETSTCLTDASIFAEVIEKAKLKDIKISLRSLKTYKKDYKWNNKNIVNRPPKDTQIVKKTALKKTKIHHKKGLNIVREAKKKSEQEPIIDKTDIFNPIALQEKVTEVMAFLLQGASKGTIQAHYKSKGEELSRADIDRLATEAYNIYANVAPAQRETILGINYERLNMLFQMTVSEIKKSPKSTGFLVGKAVQIMSEMNSMFGIRSMNLNINNTEGIQNKVNTMSEEEKYKRFIELSQNDDGTFSE